MKSLIAAVGAVLLLAAFSAAKEEEAWTRAKTGGRVRGMAAAHPPAQRFAPKSSFNANSASPQYSSAGLPSYGGGGGSGLGVGSTVKPLRSMTARSRTSGGGVFVAGGPVMNGASIAQQADPARPSAVGGGYAISAGKGRALGGPGVTKAENPDGAGASGGSNDPFQKILTGIAGIFGDMAKMLGGG